MSGHAESDDPGLKSSRDMRLLSAEQINLSRLVEIENTFVHFEGRAINHHGIAYGGNGTSFDVVASRKRNVTAGIDRDFHNAVSLDELPQAVAGKEEE
jgi:hypothetical protein